MNALLALAMLFAWDNSSPVLGMSFLSGTAGSSLAGGSLWQLQQVVTKLTGKNAILHYSFYGCYCGVGGQGQPKDATDRCCQLHDACYDSLQKYHCNAKLQCYQYSWHGNRLTCNGDSWCAQMSCECDRSLGLCLRRSAKSYNRRYVLYLKSKCR